MKCLVCGLSYINVGVHAKHKHGLTADEYRFEFGLKMSTPLVDNELSERLSKSMIARLKDDAYLKEQQHKCKENASKNIGRKWKNDLTHDARTALVESHKRRNDAYLESKRKEVEAIYQEKRTLIDIRKQIGMSPIAAKKILGNVAPDKNEWLSSWAGRRRMSAR